MLASPQRSHQRAPLVLGAAIILRHSYEIAAFALPFAIYGLSVPHQPGSWDTAELQGVPYILGIAHPTGFPLYTLLGYVFSHIFAVDTVAFRLNIFSAVCVSASCVALYLTALEFRIPKLCAFVAAMWFSIAGIVWQHAIRAEAHDLALALSSISILFWSRWLRSGENANFLWGTITLGLALATHPTAVWLLPGILLACIFRKPRPKLALRASLIIVTCILLYVYLPARSAIVVFSHLDPTTSLAGVTGGILWNYNNPSSWAGLVAEITGNQFGVNGALLSLWRGDTIQPILWSWLAIVNSTYGVFAIVVAFVGLCRLWSLDWKPTLLLLALTLGAVPFSFSYSGVEGDADRYRLLSLWLVPILIGGAASLKGSADTSTSFRQVALFTAMLVWTGQTMANNRAFFSERDSDGSRTLIHETALHIPPGSIIVVNWLDATSLAYGAYVDHSLGGRIIVAGWPGDYTPYYSSWAKEHSVYFIGTLNPDGLNSRWLSAGSLDSGHPLWRFQRAPVFGRRDPYTNRTLKP